MAVSSLGRRRPRPVADAPVLDGAELAKAWLVELVAIAPLDRAASLPGPRFAEDAPSLCSAVVAALSSDQAMADLEPEGTLAPLAAGAGELAAADETHEVLRSLEALRAVVWAAIVAAVHRPPPVMIGELADRLGAIVAILAGASFESDAPDGGLRPGDRGPLARILRNRPGDDAPEPPRPPVRPVLTTVGERPHLRVAPDAPAPPADRRSESPPGPPPLVLDPDEISIERLYSLVSVDARVTEPPTEAEIEDATGFVAGRIAPWTAAISRALARHREDGLPFAVLCVELVDLDRLVASERDGDVSVLLEAAEAGMCAQLRPADALVRERSGRYWVTTPDTDPDEARVLAHQIVAGVAAAPSHRGAPLQAAVGISACPHDGNDAGDLEDRAEESLFAARAAGVRVADPARR